MTFLEHYNPWKKYTNSNIRRATRIRRRRTKQHDGQQCNSKNKTQQKKAKHYCYYYLQLQAMYVCPNRLRRQNPCNITRRTATSQTLLNCWCIVVSLLPTKQVRQIRYTLLKQQKNWCITKTKIKHNYLIIP